MKIASFFLVIWGCLVGCLLAQAPTLKPVSNLPAEAEIQDGDLALFTNWQAAEKEGFQVVVANRTSQAVTLDYAFAHPRFYLEAKNPEGTWERATVHVDDMCGTGLGVFQLKPGTFVEGSFGIVGRGPGDGPKKRIETEIKKKRDFMRTARMTQEAYQAMLAEIKKLETELAGLEKHWAKREVRIRVYGENVKAFSNSTEMEVDLRVIGNAKRDNMAIRNSSLKRLEAIIMGDEVFEPLEQPLQVSPVHTAIYALGQPGHSVEKARAVLERVVAECENEQTVILAKQRLTYSPFK